MSDDIKRKPRIRLRLQMVEARQHAPAQQADTPLPELPGIDPALLPAQAGESDYNLQVALALIRTDKRQKAYVKRRLEEMSAPEFVSMIGSDVDYKPQAKDPRQLMEQQAAFNKEFQQVVLGTSSPGELIMELQRYVVAEQWDLFYRTNDMVAARMKQDYVNDFLNELMPALEEYKMISPERRAILGQVQQSYKLGFEAYDNLRDQLCSFHNGKSTSLLQSAQRAIELDPSLGKGSPPQEALETTAQHIVHRLIEDCYNVDRVNDTARPLLFAVLQQVRTLADLKLAQAHPECDFRDPKEEWEGKFEKCYKPLVREAMGKLSGTGSTLLNFAELSRDLKQRIAALDNIPADFGACVDRASRKAARTVLGRHEEYFAADRPRLQFYKDEGAMPRAYEMVDTLLPGSDSAGRIQVDTRGFLVNLEGLDKVYSKSGLLVKLENMLADTADEGLFGWNHPASLLAVKDFIGELRRNMAEELHQAGKGYDPAFIEHMTAIEKSVEHLYQNNVIAGQWMMQSTHGGSDNLYESSWMRRGWDPRTVKPHEVKELMEAGQAMLGLMGESRGIPDTVADSPWIPLLYERSRDVAKAELDKEKRSEMKSDRARRGFTPRSYKTALAAEAPAQPASMESPRPWDYEAWKLTRPAAANKTDDAPRGRKGFEPRNYHSFRTGDATLPSYREQVEEGPPLPRTGFRPRNYKTYIWENPGDQKAPAAPDAAPKLPVEAAPAEASPVEAAPAQRQAVEMPAPAQAERALLDRRTIEVLKEAIACITLNPPKPKTGRLLRGEKRAAPQPLEAYTAVPMFNSHNVMTIMSYLDAREERALPPEYKLHTLQ